MKASTFYRIAAVVLLLFAIGRTLGFRQSDPSWRVDNVVASMQSVHFVLYLFAAVLAWQLGRLTPEALRLFRGIAWAFAISFAAITVMSSKCSSRCRSRLRS